MRTFQVRLFAQDREVTRENACTDVSITDNGKRLIYTNSDGKRVQTTLPYIVVEV